MYKIYTNLRYGSDGTGQTARCYWVEAESSVEAFKKFANALEEVEISALFSDGTEKTELASITMTTTKDVIIK